MADASSSMNSFIVDMSFKRDEDQIHNASRNEREIPPSFAHDDALDGDFNHVSPDKPGLSRPVRLSLIGVGVLALVVVAYLNYKSNDDRALSLVPQAFPIAEAGGKPPVMASQPVVSTPATIGTSEETVITTPNDLSPANVNPVGEPTAPSVTASNEPPVPAATVVTPSNQLVTPVSSPGSVVASDKTNQTELAGSHSSVSTATQNPVSPQSSPSQSVLPTANSTTTNVAGPTTPVAAPVIPVKQLSAKPVVVDPIQIPKVAETSNPPAPPVDVQSRTQAAPARVVTPKPTVRAPVNQAITRPATKVVAKAVTPMVAKSEPSQAPSGGPGSSAASQDSEVSTGKAISSPVAASNDVKQLVTLSQADIGLVVFGPNGLSVRANDDSQPVLYRVGSTLPSGETIENLLPESMSIITNKRVIRIKY